MRYLKLFKTATKYKEYLAGDDIWLPRVSLILNAEGLAENSPFHEDGISYDPSNTDKWDDNGPKWVDFSRIGTEFIQVANNGTMYFTDTVYEKDGKDVLYRAYVAGDALCIQTIDLETRELTNDAYVDEESHEIVVNYPTGDIARYSIG